MQSLRFLSAAALVATAGAAQAAKLPLVDDFTAPEINAATWASPESVRYVDDKGRLNLGRWTFGGTASDTGTTVETFNLSATDNAPAKSLKVTIMAEDVDRVDGCAANPAISTAQARVIGSFFNVNASTPTAGDMTGDVLAQAYLMRKSSDAPGVVHVYAGVPQCTNADCSAASNLAFVDMGTVAVGTSTTLQIDWQKGNSKFVFTRDGTSADAPYTVVPTFTPGRPFINLSIRNVLAAKILRIEAAPSGSVDVLLDVDGERLRSRITREACEELRLSSGQTVFVLIKSVALESTLLG